MRGNILLCRIGGGIFGMGGGMIKKGTFGGGG